MSLLYRNELSIVLSPARIAMQCAERKLTLRGLKRYARSRETIACEAPCHGDAPWSGAIMALGLALPRFAVRNMDVTVILSNHFVHYVLVPPCGQLSEEEEVVYARHCFREVYGDAADNWELRISSNDTGAPELASAVDAKLLGELRELLRQAGMVARSIQPHLMVAYNSCHASLHGRSVWLALPEPGNLCLAMLQKGQWAWLRKTRINDSWPDELPMMLEREACLANADAAVNEVLLWAPNLDPGQIPEHGRWQIQNLKPDFGLEHGALFHDGGDLK